MNKHSIILLATVMAISACTVAPDNDVKVTDDVDLVITAYQEGYSDTKTTVIEGGTLVYWESNDEVKVFYKTTGSRFTSTNTEPAGKADFTGNLTITGFFNEGFTADTPLWAVYPYRSDATSDGESVTTTLPAEQTGRAGSFAKSTFITLAKSANTQMGFYNVCGGVRFSLTHEGVKEVIFEGQNDEDIAGKVKLVFADGVPVVQEVIEGQKSITLTAPGGGTFQTGQWYYIVALPGTLSNGFKMTFNTETQYATLKSSGTKTIKRGIFGSLTDADEGLIYKDKGVGPTPEDVIQFEDPSAKYACVDKFDTDKDGEVSYAEAAAATTLSGLFTDWNTVTSFDEIRFFTSVTSTQGVFTGLKNLKHITIPDNITTLGTFENCTSLDTVKLPAALASLPTYCFDGCSSLKSVTLPTGITSIPDYAFRNCSSLSTLAVPFTLVSVGKYAFSGCTILMGIDLPSGFRTIGNYAFQNCLAITSLDFPSSLSSIGQYAYSGCTALNAVKIGNSVSIGQYAFKDCIALESAVLGGGVSVGYYAFLGCSTLTSVVLPQDMTDIPSGCFYSCTKLASIIWPNELANIGDYAFYGCFISQDDLTFNTIELPSTVKTVGAYAFYGVRHLIMPSASAISIASNSFIIGYTRLYVPSGMVEMYKVRTNWSGYSRQILPISDYPVVSFPYEVPDAIDLGLSVKWASFNIGASAPERYGDYFAWGETEPYYIIQTPMTMKDDKPDGYTWSSYKWCNGNDNWLTKYCNDSRYGDNGFTDYKVVLDPEDDAASVHFGDSWHMPTDDEWLELERNCTWTWSNLNGVAGMMVTSNVSGYTDKWIFLPAAGFIAEATLYYRGHAGYSWSSSLRTNYYSRASYVDYCSGYVPGLNSNRSKGLTIRAVCSKE